MITTQRRQIPVDRDVYGALLKDALAGKHAMEIVERDDGLMLAYDASYLLAPFSKWDDPMERRAISFIRGRVLDVGCGGGRVCLHLQQRGFDVLGIDSSPGAVACCRRRGVRKVSVLDIHDAVPAGLFDTIVLLGQNFGLMASRARARRILHRLASVSTSSGRIVAETFDYSKLRDSAQRKYVERNMVRGRMPGQLRLRIRYRNRSTRWFDFLQVKPSELRNLLAGTEWTLSRTLGNGASYVAIIERRG